jgi:hypothetical protein
MLKEIKYLLHISAIFTFFFVSLKFYISDNYKKEYYRSLNNQQKLIKDLAQNLPTLKNDTKNIIEYVDSNKNKAKKKYEFWKLIEND